jgi:two-component system sensor histidine kinase QseC
MRPGIGTSLWFNKEALEAAKFYGSIFKKSKIELIHYQPDGSVLAVYFKLNGQQFIAVNAGPQFKFSWAVSMVITVDTQKELDTYWHKLTAGGGVAEQCGWLKDKYGLSWQIWPRTLTTYLKSKNKKKTAAVFAQVLKLVKLDFAPLEKAFKNA